MEDGPAGYRCRSCGTGYGLEQLVWRCHCGGALDLHGLRPDLRPRDLPWSMWRYRRALPVTRGWEGLTLGEGMTPLVAAGPDVWFKLDFLMPTGSYKDRGAVSLILGAQGAGARRVIADSSGNAGLSIATYARRAGLDATIFIPTSTSRGKVARLQRTGAALRLVPGDRTATASAAVEALDPEADFYASHVHNPLFHHGTKTFAYELWEQLGGRAPGTVILPAGNGTILLGAAIGFSELVAAGRADHLPRLVAVQAASCAPLAAAFFGRPGPTSVHETVAEGIAIPAPPRLHQMVEAIRHSDGTVLTVDDRATVAAQGHLLDQGLEAEPTAAVGVAAWEQWPERDEAPPPVVIALTGRNA